MATGVPYLPSLSQALSLIYLSQQFPHLTPGISSNSWGTENWMSPDLTIWDKDKIQHLFTAPRTGTPCFDLLLPHVPATFLQEESTNVTLKWPPLLCLIHFSPCKDWGNHGLLTTGSGTSHESWKLIQVTGALP